jgi:hypothetical protein
MDELLERNIHMAEAALKMTEVLYEILCSSDEPETIRKALAALTSTDSGIEYLRMNPLAL